MICLTGAGVSVESGIPDFRSAGGLWEKYDPMVYAAIDTFHSHPEKTWDMVFDMLHVFKGAKPNPCHKALAELEDMGLLKTLITQNIDNLHQAAGSRKVIEYHGNASSLECLVCGIKGIRPELKADDMRPPRCHDCGGILKPSVIFFGEMIPPDALAESEKEAGEADLVLVAGTSAVVYPAANIPLIAKRKGANLIVTDIEPTQLGSHVADIFLEGKAGVILPRLVKQVKNAIKEIGREPN
jgi:NAD-dependent deacetylase